mmetsp:Transcript_83377/g.231402  ORF Transcript_83377/g.231402 Transcript_83377/m.231402 type:complete len:512 (-) Transcript_83377:70-1605(-)
MKDLLPFRRFQSAPADGRSPQDSTVYSGDLRLPETPGVRLQLAESGPATTLLDVALGIAARLLDVPGTDPAEVLFVRNCLKAGHAKTAVPCGLLAREDGRCLEDFLLGTYNLSVTPTSSMTSRTTCSQPLACVLEEEDDETVPRWPVKSNDVSLAKELQDLVEAHFDTWGFDTFALCRLTNGKPLQFAGWEALRRTRCFAELEIAPEKAQNFLRSAEGHYGKRQAIPYHNNLHAADVTQCVYALLANVGFAVFFDPLSTLALVLSAIIHDMGHDGRNNTFHINVHDPLALTYNDQSVLENFHVSQAFKMLLGDPDMNMLSELPKEKLARARKEMIDDVLGTDMAHHFRHVSTFKTLSDKLDCEPEEWAAPEARTALGIMVLHSADISNPAKPARLSETWTDLLKQEFFMQGDEEKRLGLPVSPLCDRCNTSFATSQVGFIQFVVRPTFELLQELAPITKVAIFPEIDSNVATWEERKQREEVLPQKFASDPGLTEGRWQDEENGLARNGGA